MQQDSQMAVMVLCEMPTGNYCDFIYNNAIPSLLGATDRRYVSALETGLQRILRCN